MTARSSITITYDGNDITSDVMYQTANFEQNAGAVPGQFSFRVKDIDRTHSFIPGKEITLSLDGQKVFGGILLIVTRTFAFPVVDTGVISNVQERIWDLSGSDYNIWLDKLVLHNPSNYLKAIGVTDGSGSRMYDGEIIRNTMSDYFDVPAGMNLTSEVQDIRRLGNRDNGKFFYPTQGAKWRDVLESMRTLTGATYFIDADKKLHWHPVGKTQHSWGLTDKPGNYTPTQMIGCREVRVAQDGGGMVTDALVWSGNQIYADSDSYQPDGGGLFFTRYPEAPASRKVVDGEEIWTKSEEQVDLDKQSTWGRWQQAEQHFGQGNSRETGAVRAFEMVHGPRGAFRGIEGGLSVPLWDVTASWFGHDVPGGAHIPAGYLVNLIFHALGDNAKPMVKFLPLRHSTITFPVIPEDPVGEETYVKFTGRFGISYSDHRKLWKVLKRGRRSINRFAAANAVISRYTQVEQADPATPSAPTGAFGQLPALPESTTVYATGSAYISGTLRVYLNGLYQRPGLEYFESDPAQGEIEFYTGLLDTDEVFIEFRAAGDTV
jgi:hypothetical protein